MKDFSDLSKDQVAELMNRYYDGEKATQLIEEYDLNAQPSNLYKLFPPEVLDELCEYCHVNLLKPRESKTNQSYHFLNEAKIYCPRCSHKPNISHCNCQNCIDKARIRRENMVAAIRREYSVEYDPIDYSNLSFKSKVFLGALVRTVVNEDLYNVIPYDQVSKRVSPTIDLDAEIYKRLHRERIILVDPSSSIDSFDIQSKDFPNVFYTFKVKYTLNLLFPTNKNDLFTSIISPNFYTEDLADEALKMWRKIAVQECIEYLEYQLNSVRFEFTPGEKTEAIFNTLLNDFSVSQIYAIIWSCVAHASRDYQEHRMSKKQAGNSVVSRCQKYGEKAKLSNWDIKKFSRLRDLPQSELSLYFFNQVVRIGERGFNHAPNLDDLGFNDGEAPQFDELDHSPEKSLFPLNDEDEWHSFAEENPFSEDSPSDNEDASLPEDFEDLF